VHLTGEKYIYDLIAKGENLNTDFKFEISDSRKIARSVSAFANTDGGRLLVGVKDNGKIAGIRSEEEFYMIQAATTLYLKPKMNPEYRNWNIKGMHVLEIIVPKSENTIYYAQDENRHWKPYVRIHDQNHLAPRLLEIIWKKKNKKGILLKYSVAESCLLQMVSADVSVSREQFKKKALVSDSEADEIISDLVSINVLRYFFQDTDLRFSLAPGFRIEQYFKGD
jgi:predicted HTH transcriptional regulator